MGRVSDKHNPRIDDAMKDDLEPAERVSDGSHADGRRDPEGARGVEPVDQPLPLDSAEGRSMIARSLHRFVFPARKADLVADVARHDAPVAVVQALRSLPDDGEYQNVQDIWLALGGEPDEESL